ncbi:MAG: allantoicase [Thermoleophilia bacterium]|nr:allantoicase [Thermoleophilia bacterium]
MQQQADKPVRVAFTSLPDLASELVGGSVCSCTDEFFAPVESLVRRSEPVFDPDAFAPTGKVMDGWESQRGRRRTRTGGETCDHAIVVLGVPGELVGVDVDTSWFMRNSPRSVELHAAELAPGANPEGDDVTWVPLAPRTQVDADTHNLVPVDPAARGRRFTHVRLTIHPDGGVARLRCHGIGRPQAGVLDPSSNELVDLAALANGGVTVAASDEFYGGISNLLLPGDSQRMDEGWETSRTRDRSHDEWVVVRLAAPGRVRRITVDTAHFKGNAPDSVRLEGVLLGERAASVDPAVDALDWVELVPTSDVGPHAVHELDAVDEPPVVDHVRLVIEPDGGIARLRVWGEVAEAGR